MVSRGITVNAVASGTIEGNMIESVFDKVTLKKLVPMQRAESPDEMALLNVYLASESAGCLQAGYLY